MLTRLKERTLPQFTFFFIKLQYYLMMAVIAGRNISQQINEYKICFCCAFRKEKLILIWPAQQDDSTQS